MNNLNLYEKLDNVESKLCVLYSSMLQIATKQGDFGDVYIEMALIGCNDLFGDLINQLKSVKKELD